MYLLYVRIYKYGNREKQRKKKRKKKEKVYEYGNLFDV